MYVYSIDSNLRMRPNTLDNLISSLLIKISYPTVFLILVVICPHSSPVGSGERQTRPPPSFDDHENIRKSLPSPVSSLTTTNGNGNRRQNDDFFSSMRGRGRSEGGNGNFHLSAASATTIAEAEPMIPFIEPATMNTTVYLGQTASLPCVVKHLGDKTVSWIRGKDLHILTSGIHVYTNDRRVVLSHHDGKLRHLWTLNIKNIEKDDEGVYECQLNTEPKLTSLHYLHVLIGPVNDDSGDGGYSRQSPLASLDSRMHLKRQENAAQILGPSIIRHHKGDTVHFTCLVPNTRSTTNVTWFLNDVPIERSSVTRGGFRIETEVFTYSVMSKLIMLHVFKRDEGKYSCGGLSVYPASITLIVHDDSKQSDDAASSTGHGHGFGGGGGFRTSSSSSAGSKIMTRIFHCSSLSIIAYYYYVLLTCSWLLTSDF